MKEKLLKLLKIFILATVIILVTLVVVGIALALQWPWWVILFLLLFIAGLVIGCFFIRNLLFRQNEMKFVNEVIAQDDAHIRTLSGKEQEDRKLMQAKWKKSIEILRNSHLKKIGNPLYVLPWYLVIGESGSGKTTSLNSARLASPFADHGKTDGISGTRNCEWWFLEQAIVIDTAGRYCIPVNGESDRQEWQNFLSLLAKYRKKEPLNGLIVTIAADKLLSAEKSAIEDEARIMRRRIDELMRVLGIKFPVYVLVTKCDLIQGINRFCEQLPADSLKQPMGMINQSLSDNIPAFLESAVQTVSKRLRNMRILLLHQLEQKHVDPPLLFFPEEFDDIKQGLSLFVKTTFGVNPYQETPILRGLFFSSGRQQGNPLSHFSRSLGLTAARENLPGTTKGLFLHDFFANVLPKDRRLLAPTRRAMEWSALTGNLGLSAWVVLCIALCGLLSFSFVKNLHTIGGISKEFQKLPVLQGEYLSDLTMLDSFRKGIIRVVNQNENWWIPRFGLRESIHVEKELKGHYCHLYQVRFGGPFDQSLMQSIQMLDAAASDNKYAKYMVHLVRRINILRDAPYSANLERLGQKPQPSHIVMYDNDPVDNPETREVINRQNFYYLAWREDSDQIRNEIVNLEAAVKSLYDRRGVNLQWLLALANQDSSLLPVTLNDFWGGGQQASEERQVPPCFTRHGKEVMDRFFIELSQVYPDALSLTSNKTAFDEKYRTLCFEAWQHFADGFSKGIERLNTTNELDRIANYMASSDGGPYSALIDKITTQLSPLHGGGEIPGWLFQIARFQAMKAQGTAYKAGFFKTMTESVKKKAISVEKATGHDAGSQKLDMEIKAAQGYTDYKNALKAIEPATTSRKFAFELAGQTFNEDPVIGKSPFHVGYRACQYINKGMGDGNDPESTFARLISGPFDYLWLYVRNRAAEQLESQWSQQVLAPTLGMSSQQMMPLLVGADGLVWKFVKDSAAPFLSRNERVGYYPKEVLGGTVALAPSFYNFLNKGARAQATQQLQQKNYNVGVNGLPTSANADAKLQPHGTRLELQCGGSAQALMNNNFPVSKTFFWAPDTCGDVILNIEVSDIVLSRRYTGPQAFPSFLRDFRGGTRVFYAREFPGEKDLLEKLKIKFIKVAYQFVGNVPVVQTVESMPVALPGSIGR
ncbi:MAG: type VI secretion protein IcmF/TssM N-terminal domain-containing protein [Smithellaceae bacterium]